MSDTNNDRTASESQPYPRIGVFVCRCGVNIAGFLDTEAVAAYAQTLPGVVYVKENLFTCAESGTVEIKRGIEEHHLDRVVVAACTPCTHEPLFRAICQEAGLNPFLFEFVNIREHCSWVHKDSREQATEKAKGLIRMGVARAAYLEPLEEITAEVEPRALVIGGGVSGMSAALALGDRGVEVVLVERADRLGGRVAQLHSLAPSGVDAKSLVDGLIQRVQKHSKIRVKTASRIHSVAGYIGNYQITLQGQDGEEEVKVGAIVVATGSDTFIPNGLYEYDGEHVIDLMELERRMGDGGVDAHDVVFVLCAGSRDENRVYCSRICCMAGLKNAILLKEAYPDIGVTVLYRDLMTTGIRNEEILREAKERGVRFVHFAPQNPPVVENGTVRVSSPLLGRELTLPADLVVLATPLVPAEGASDLSRLLKVPLDENGFFLEAHVKLRPVDFATDGIFVCGSAHWPASVEESITQALGAAGRASIPLVLGTVKVEPIVSFLIDEDLCRGCGLCSALCPYGAIEIVETENGPKARMISVACKGCGVCGATCYRRAIKMSHFSDEQLGAQIDAAFREGV